MLELISLAKSMMPAIGVIMFFVGLAVWLCLLIGILDKSSSINSFQAMVIMALGALLLK